MAIVTNPGGTHSWELDLTEECPGCRVTPGEHHDDECDHAHCPGCGEQLLMHDCGDSDRPSLWHGDNPAAIKAHELGWMEKHPAPNISGPVPQEAYVRALRDWDPTTQTWQ